MKLLRYGPQGAEKPGLLDADGKIRDLSGLVGDIGGATLSDEGLDRLRRLDTSKLPEVDPSVRLGPCVGGTGKFICIGLNYSDHAAETGATRAARADHLHEGDQRHLRPGRPGDHPARLGEDRLGGRARLRHRQARQVRLRGRRARPRGRLLPGQRRLRARLPDRAPGPVVQGQVGRPLRPDRPLARHPRRGRRPAEAADVAEGQRRRRARTAPPPPWSTA